MQSKFSPSTHQAEEFSALVNQAFEAAIAEQFSLDVGELEISSRENEPSGLTEFCIFTICSHLFRMNFVFMYSHDESVKQFIKSKFPNEAVTPELFDAHIAEMGNVLTGVIKRELGRRVKSMGMSTPTVLTCDCLDTLPSSPNTHYQFKDIIRGGELILSCRLYTSTYGDVDRTLTTEVIADTSLMDGELELF